MFNLKFIVVTSIVLSSILVQQSAMAYPRASKKAEMNFLKSVVALQHGQYVPHLNDKIEAEYRNKSESTQTALISGYEMCDDIKEANQQGVSGYDLLAQETANLTSVTSQTTGIVLTANDIVSFYDNATGYLCPGLY